MVFTPFLALWEQIKGMKPSFLRRKPHFTFITVHYFWIIGMSILGSILVYIPRNIDYIDALFFATGSCTQSGLNPIDLNLLNTYQQIVLYILPMMTNPITNNTFVVFLRLYWFEKRFQHIAKEAKRQRRSMSKSRSMMKGERDAGMEEHGVNGRQIRVMHGATTPGTNGKQVDKHGDEPGMSGDPRNRDDYALPFDKTDTDSRSLSPNEDPPPLKTQPTIKFADQVKRSDGVEDENSRMPSRRDTEAHIAFLERQRNRDDGILRIPGPRDADRGVAPETINEEVPRTPTSLHRLDSQHESFRHGSDGAHEEHMQSPTQNDTADRSITIEDHPSRARRVAEEVADDTEAAAYALDICRLRRRKTRNGENNSEDPDNDNLNKVKSRSMSFATLKHHFTKSKEEEDSMPYISFQPTMGRNSAFVDLSEEEREELGGIEYRSLKTLAMVLVSYFWFWTAFATISLVPWILNTPRYGSIVDAAGQNRTWWGFFTATSSFNDLGFALTPDSMISFQTAVWPLLVMSFLIIIGNTGFPVMLRWIIWLCSKVVPRGSGIWEELKFLLDHPRRCFTLLFPSTATWWLFWVLVLLNGVDLVFFIILDFGNPVVTDLAPGIRVLDGWFQATATRTAGFAVVNVGDLHPAIQISYLIMMYISVFPIAISVRRTNVYEEQSLGIWGSSADETQDEAEPSYVGSHVRRQLSFDLWFVALGWFIMAIAESKPLMDPLKPGFNLFSTLFEIVSAYGTVGLSLGYPGTNASLSAQFNVVGKLVIIAMQVRGRHRGLPYELDRAILLPSESLHKREEDEAAARKRRGSFGGNTAEGGEELRAAMTSGSEREAPRPRERQASNFLSSMMHPGPSAPARHRQVPFVRRVDSGTGAGAGAGAGEGGEGRGVARTNTHVPTTGRGGEAAGFAPLKKRMSL